MSEEDIQFLDSGPEFNFYDAKSDIVVIDSNLDDYPLAKEYIIDHELGHKERGRNLWSQLVHEFRNDLFMKFSFSDTAVELREYSERESKVEKNFEKWLVFSTVNALRSLWILVVYPLGNLYRSIRRRL